MANFAAVKPGGWAWEDPITPDHITGIQEMLMKAPNFSEGSIHDPTGLISVGGSGIWHSNPFQLVTTSGTVVFADQASFLVCGLSTGSSVYLSDDKSTGGAIPNGTVVFAINNSTANQVILYTQVPEAICIIPAQTTGPNVVSMAIVWRVSNNWATFWASPGVTF